MPFRIPVAIAATVALLAFPATATPADRDLYADTWVGVDDLGRVLPTHEDVGPPREDKVVAMFYFVWLGRHENGGPYDISRILAEFPGALDDTDHPAWGPMFAFHHWGESIFGHYRSEDRHVLRKHAQMLADADVDVLVFDCSNQFHYPESYWPLLHVFRDVRDAGNRTPGIAFLGPFGGDMNGFVTKVYNDLYRPDEEAWTPVNDIGGYTTGDGHLRLEITGPDPYLESPDDLGVNADNYPTLVVRMRNQTAATQAEMFFTTDDETNWSGDRRAAFSITPNDDRVREYRVDLSAVPGWSGSTLKQFRLDPVVAETGAVLLESIVLEPANRDFPPMYGWWFGHNPFEDLLYEFDGKPLFLSWDQQVQDPVIRDHFTFRRPMPDYQAGPSGTNQWSWLEIYPQHVFPSETDPNEQMSVGVAQNAVDLPDGTVRAPSGFQEPNARARSYHKGTPPPGDGVDQGFNFQQQWDHALAADPRVIFITQWNEWTAMRFTEFAGVSAPVVFVDVLDQDRSRCVEPMKGGHGDNYYYQMIANIRRFKGAREIPSATLPRRIDIAAGFDPWDGVGPEFRDTIGDLPGRADLGYGGQVRYVNQTGRNDIVAAKATFDATYLYFYVETAEPITPRQGIDWMNLFLDVDGDMTNGWDGFDYRINVRAKGAGTVSIHVPTGVPIPWTETPETARIHTEGNKLALAVPRAAVGLAQGIPAFDFKWSDNVDLAPGPINFTVQGDTAPNDRYRYRYIPHPDAQAQFEAGLMVR